MLFAILSQRYCRKVSQNIHNFRQIMVLTYEKPSEDATKFSCWFYEGSYVEFRRKLLVAIGIKIYLNEFIST